MARGGEKESDNFGVEEAAPPMVAAAIDRGSRFVFWVLVWFAGREELKI